MTADWRAAGALSEHALDARVPHRVALWHAANDIAMRLASIRQAPRMQLARAAFFHWTELSAADRRAALATIAPLLRDPATFSGMAKPLFDLTGDLALLRRWNPGSARALELLRNLAATNGRFADYRELRQDVVRQRTAEFRESLPRLTAAEIIAALPPPPYSTDDEPLLRDALAELHRRPLTEDPHHAAELGAFVDYALRHRGAGGRGERGGVRGNEEIEVDERVDEGRGDARQRRRLKRAARPRRVRRGRAERRTDQCDVAGEERHEHGQQADGAGRRG